MGFIAVWFVLLIRYAIVVRRRFRAERERQLIITRPKVAVRLGGSTLVQVQKEGNNREEAYAAKLIHPYHFYQQATQASGSGVAPGEMTLRPRQREKLETDLLKHEEVYAFIDPQRKGEPFLTPGPQLFSWTYLGKSLGVILLAAFICWRGNHTIITMVTMYTALGILFYQLGGRYPNGLHEWIEPVHKLLDTKQGARPQVQTDVEEADLELPPLEDQPKKITLRR